MACIEQLEEWRDQLEEPYFERLYRANMPVRTLGGRRSYIRDRLTHLFGAAAYSCKVEDTEQLRRYFDAKLGIPIDPNDSTLHKYDYLTVVLDVPDQPKPKKGNTIMDKNLAALLRSDAKTLTVRFMVDTDTDNGTRKSKPYTYVSHLPLTKGDSVVVDANGRGVVAVVESVDGEAKIEPGSDIEYKWVIAKIDMAAHEANEARNAAIVAEAAVIVRENMRRSFAAQVLGAASPEQRDKLLQLTGNVAG